MNRLSRSFISTLYTESSFRFHDRYDVVVAGGGLKAVSRIVCLNVPESPAMMTAFCGRNRCRKDAFRPCRR
jgi:hypothetical protein